MKTDAGKKRRVPNLFIVGAPKCGSTSLFWYLGDHPEIFASNNKEPNYFIYDSLVRIGAMKTKLKRAIKTEEVYLDLFIDENNEKYIMDGSIFTYFFEDALKKLITLSPDYRAVFIIRNPVDRFISHYKMCVNLGEVKKPLHKFIDNPFGGMAVDMLELGLYGKYIEKAFKVLNSDRVHIIILDDLKNDAKNTLFSLCDFLGIEKVLPGNMDKVFLKSLGVARNAKVHNIYIKSKFFKFLKSAFRKTPIYKLKTVINRRLYQDFSVSHEVKEKLYGFYKDDIVKLEKLIGRNLKDWRFDG